MKKFLAFLITSSIVILLVVRCTSSLSSSQNRTIDQDLVGRWIWSTNFSYQLTLNDDATGTWSGVMESFDWFTDNLDDRNVLVLVSIENRKHQLAWVYEILEDNVNLNIAQLIDLENQGRFFQYWRMIE